MRPAWPSVRWTGWLWASLLFLVPRSTSSFKSFIMADRCDHLIDLQDLGLPVMHLRLTDRDSYRPRMKCKMSVRAPPGQQLVVTFEALDIAPGYSLCADFLSLLDGELQERSLKHVPGAPTMMCGTKAPAPVTSSGRAVTFKFDSNGVEEGRGFTAVITPFHQGNCTRDEYRCNNGRCIDRRLMCDDHDNCGDGSDNCWLSVTAVVVIVIITIIVFAILVFVAIIYLYKDTLKKTFLRKKKPVVPTNPDGVYQPTTEAVSDELDNADTPLQV